VETLPLFEEPSDFDRAGLRDKLAALAAEDVWIGTSSWKYPGWIGQVYTRSRYSQRGRFSEKRFEAECLREYAGTFPIVCGDFSFYQFPSEAFWQRLFGTAPAPLKFAFKVPEEITVKIFRMHPRYGPRAGEKNPSFLNAVLLQNVFLDLLEPYRDRIAVLIFEFGSFSGESYGSATEFAAQLDPFLAVLPDRYRYAVEIRNQEFLTREYFQCLARHGIAHVFNAWTRMPELDEQMCLPEAFTADFTVARALLRRTRPYADAVEKFTPYQEIRDPNPAAREALKNLIQRARDRHEPSYIFVNNRLEGNAPLTIQAVVD